MTYFADSLDKELSRGDDLDIDVFAKTPDVSAQAPGVAIDLTGWVLTFTLKRERDDGASVHADTPAVRKTSDDTSEILILDQSQSATQGRARVLLVGADTKFLAPGVYVYDVRGLAPDNKSHTLRRGRIYLQGGVTAAEDASVP